MEERIGSLGMSRKKRISTGLEPEVHTFESGKKETHLFDKF